MSILVNSEIGRLKKVMLHSPGPEVESMTPKNASKSLYSDILNLEIAKKEYQQLFDVLQKTTEVYLFKDTLYDCLLSDENRSKLISDLCNYENCKLVVDDLIKLDNKELTNALVEGHLKKNDSLSNYLSKDKYSFAPIPNIFFMRDPGVAINNTFMSSNMASPIRRREAFLLNYIVQQHQSFKNENSTNHFESPSATFEGGDILIIKDNILVIGLSQRTNAEGIDLIINALKRDKKNFHVIVQELPSDSESFIHLDMTFTLLNKDECMVYKPLILDNNSFQTIRIDVENGAVKNIRNELNLLSALKNIGVSLNPVVCGGDSGINQEREQWHSGANFFVLEPGKIIGYSRNSRTNETLNKHGYEIVSATKFIKEKKSIDHFNKVVITLEGSELSRGGGGPRCMTLPLQRDVVSW